MNFLRRCAHILAFKGITPVILGCYGILYVGIAFYNDEALITLMTLVRNNSLLILLLCCVPLNLLAILSLETARFFHHRRAMGLSPVGASVVTFQEAVDHLGTWEMDLLERKLAQTGYHHRRKGHSCAAWKGISIFPARALSLAGGVCLFAGIALSIATRVSFREAAIEGEPLPEAVGVEGRVERIVLRPTAGLILARTLAMDITLGEGERTKLRQFDIYPPGRIGGLFLYPRYLGLAPFVKFAPPEPGQAFASYIKLMIYPPGKEDGADIPQSPYKIFFTLAEPVTGEDPYATGRFVLNFRVVKGNAPVFEGMLPLGGTVSKGGYNISFPEVKRFVVVDFVRDPGLPLVWLAALFFTLAAGVYIPIRLLAPRREMLFLQDGGVARAFSMAEGGGGAHRSVFHGILDAAAPGE
jgi:hypothetical protein